MDPFENELDNLRRLVSQENLSILKEKETTIVSINVRKCLVLRVVLDHTNARVLTAKLYVSELKNLKPERIRAIEEFLEKANSSISTIIDDTNSSILADLYEKCTLMLVREDFLNESFDVIETKAKTCGFKFDGDEQPKQSVLKNTVDSRTTKKNVETKKEEKKPQKLKGSEYIFHRIKWDTNIDKNQVVIGYLDRFKGIKDIQFDDFKRVHEDYKEGVPFHRIRYFKINDRIVWDREQKIDLLTGSGEEVMDFFEKKEISSPEEILIDENDEVLESNIDVFVDGEIYKFRQNQWSAALNENDLNVNYVKDFKLLTYNLMSKLNFKKSILSKIKFKKSQLEIMNKAIENEDEYGLKALEKIDRMEIIIKSIRESNWDFLLLQECDQYEEDKLKEDEFIQKNYYICR